MKSTVKQLTALLVLLAMVLSVLPMGAFAQEPATPSGETPVVFSTEQDRENDEETAFSGTIWILTGPFEQLAETQYSDQNGWDSSAPGSFQIRFKDAEGQEIGAANVTATSLPQGFTAKAGNGTLQDDGGSVSFVDVQIAQTVTASDTPYSLMFSVGGVPVTIRVNVKGSGGGPVVSMPVLEYSVTGGEGTWAPAPVGGMPLDLPTGESRYFRVTRDGSPIPVTASLNEGTVGQAELVGETANTSVIQVKGGAVNGKVIVSFSFADGFQSTALFVTGNTVPADPESAYKAAQVKQVFPNSGTVEFTGVSGSLTEQSAGFSLAGTTLSFDTQGKASGLYTAKAGEKLYAVAVMQTLSVENVGAETVVMGSYQPGSLPGGPDGLYYCNGFVNGGQAKQMIFGTDSDGTVNPIYLYRFQNSQPVSLEGYSFTIYSPFMDVSDYLQGEIVTVSGVQVLKLSVKPGVLRSATVPGFVSLYDAQGGFVGSVEFTWIGNSGTDCYGFTTDPAKVDNNEMQARSALGLQFPVGSMPAAADFYITKGSGDNGNSQPAAYDFVLYDEIKIETLTITSSNNAFVSADRYIASTPDGRNAIGFSLQVKDNTQPQMAEITVTFKDNADQLHTYRGAVVCMEAAVSETATVSNVAEFMTAYNSMSSGTIVMEAGTYSMDLVHNKPIAIRAAEGASVVINGANATNEAAIVTIGLANPGEISGITIDGRGKARDGIDPNNFNAYATGITVQNCRTGVRKTGSWAILAQDSTFENNETAIDGTAGRLVVQNCTFTQNTTAVSFGAQVYTECRVQQNKFLGNTTDFAVNTGAANLVVTQNYYSGNKPVIAPEQATLYYSPYFANDAMTVLTADLAGSRPGSAARSAALALTVPVDRTITEASAFDNALFNEMKAYDADVTVNIPVTERKNDKNQVTTIWGFERDTLAQAPAAMDLAVSDQPSDSAETVVEEAEDLPHVLQYVNFAHTGALPGTATVKVLKTSGMNARDLKLFYIDTQNNQVVPVEATSVSEQTVNGLVYYVVTVDHCSEYVITADTLVQEGSTGGDNSAEPSAPAATPAPEMQPAADGEKESSGSTAANDLINAVEIAEKFEASQDNTVTLSVDQKRLVSARAFQLLGQYPDKALVLQGDGYSWTFAASDLRDPDAIQGASLDTTISLTSPNRQQIAALAGEAQIVNVYFNYHGALPGTAQIRLYIGAQYADSVRYLYYYNSGANLLEYLGEAPVDKQGNVSFSIEHCSDYVLLDRKLNEAEPEAPVEEEDPSAEPQPTPESEAPAEQAPAESGGMFQPVMLLIAAGLLLGLLLVIWYLRKQR